MSIEKEFVPCEESLELKELGFDEPCFGYHLCKNSALGVYLEITTEWIDLFAYDSASCKAPTFSQAFRFFREKYKIYSTIIYRVSVEDGNEYWDWLIKGEEVVYKHFKTYEEAELACLRKLIQIVKEKL